MDIIGKLGLMIMKGSVNKGGEQAYAEQAKLVEQVANVIVQQQNKIEQLENEKRKSNNALKLKYKKETYKLKRSKVSMANQTLNFNQLKHQITCLESDKKELSGQYDKLVETMDKFEAIIEEQNQKSPPQSNQVNN